MDWNPGDPGANLLPLFLSWFCARVWARLQSAAQRVDNMASTESSSESLGRPQRDFRTTHWSLVLAASGPATPEAAAALEQLCATYWYPLYSFLRRHHRSHHDAQDLTQSFIAQLLEKSDGLPEAPVILRLQGPSFEFHQIKLQGCSAPDSQSRAG